MRTAERGRKELVILGETCRLRKNARILVSRQSLEILLRLLGSEPRMAAHDR
jgi:hypothetical protein